MTSTTRIAGEDARKRRTLPVSLLFLGLLLLELALQWLPVPGAIMMLFGAPLWSVVLINLLLISVTVEAIWGVLPRWLLALPVGVYLVNAAASAQSYYSALAERAEILRRNSAQAVAFDPRSDALVAPRDIAQELAQSYQVRVVYAADPSRPRSYRVLPKTDCRGFADDPAGPVTAKFVLVGDARASNVCLLGLDEAPPSRAFEARVDAPSRAAGLNTVRVVGPDGRSGAFTYGRIGVLSPVPMPVIGCALIDSANRWDCFARLMPLSIEVARRPGRFDQDQEASALAALLKLKPRTLKLLRPSGMLELGQGEADLGETLRTAPDRDRALALADSLLASGFDAALGELPDYLRGADGPHAINIGPTLARHSERTVRWADDMASALAEAVRTHNTDRMYNLGVLIAALPRDAFQRLGGRLVTLGADERLFESAPTLLVRLGDLGPASLPILRRALADSTGPVRSRPIRDARVSTAAVLGLCRAGVVASGSADAVAALPRSEPRDAELRVAAFVALERMGRPDLARGVAGEARAAMRHRFEGDNAQVTPASPAAQCRIGPSWLDLPG